jgi:hypothetical protein
MAAVSYSLAAPCLLASPARIWRIGMGSAGPGPPAQAARALSVRSACLLGELHLAEMLELTGGGKRLSRCERSHACGGLRFGGNQGNS